jgi:hypothetical protein
VAARFRSACALSRVISLRRRRAGYRQGGKNQRRGRREAASRSCRAQCGAS